MKAAKWECDILDNSDGIFLMHTGRSQAAEPVYHDFIMIAYVAHGDGFHQIGEEKINIMEGDIFIVNPDTIHCLYPSERTKYLEFYYCFLSKQKAQIIRNNLKTDFPELNFFFDNPDYLHTKDTSNKEIRTLFVRMIDEFMHCPPGYNGVVNSYLTVMLTMIFRRYQNSVNNPVFNRNKIVDEIIRYVNYNIGYGVKVADIADALHLSIEYLCRTFKKHTGTTIKQFIIDLKIERIKDLLRNTDRSIDSICISLNCNQVYLNRLFKKHTGMTLLIYRKKHHYKA